MAIFFFAEVVLWRVRIHLATQSNLIKFYLDSIFALAFEVRLRQEELAGISMENQGHMLQASKKSLNSKDLRQSHANDFNLSDKFPTIYIKFLRNSEWFYCKFFLRFSFPFELFRFALRVSQRSLFSAAVIIITFKSSISWVEPYYACLGTICWRKKNSGWDHSRDRMRSNKTPMGTVLLSQLSNTFTRLVCARMGSLQGSTTQAWVHTSRLQAVLEKFTWTSGKSVSNVLISMFWYSFKRRF